MKAKRIFLILTLLWMVIIFIFSSHEGSESSSDSSGFIAFICSHIIPSFSSWSEEEQLSLIEKVSYPVRKCAHAFEYFLLATLLFFTLRSYSKERKNYLYAWAIATLYALSDEIHQLFVPGRSAHILDVLIDSAGASVALAIIALAFHIARKHNQGLKF